MSVWRGQKRGRDVMSVPGGAMEPESSVKGSVIDRAPVNPELCLNSGPGPARNYGSNWQVTRQLAAFTALKLCHSEAIAPKVPGASVVM